MAPVTVDGAVDGEHGLRITFGPEEHDADLGLVEAQVEERVVELAPGGDRPGTRAGLEESRRALRLTPVRRPDGERGDALLAVDRETHPAVLGPVRRARG